MGRMVVATIWFLSLIYPLENYLLLNKMPYNPTTFRCSLPLSDFAVERAYWWWLAPLNVTLIMLLPMLIVVGSTVWLLAYVQRVHGLHRQVALHFMFTQSILCILNTEKSGI